MAAVHSSSSNGADAPIVVMLVVFDKIPYLLTLVTSIGRARTHLMDQQLAIPPHTLLY